MALHILTAISAVFGEYKYSTLVKGQRTPLIPGMCILSDLIVDDDWIQRASVYWKCSFIDEVYADYRDWQRVYIPSLMENQLIYDFCSELYISRPAQQWSLDDAKKMTESLNGILFSRYIRASVAASIALRVLMGRSLCMEIDALCEDILLFIKYQFSQEFDLNGQRVGYTPLMINQKRISKLKRKRAQM